MNPPPNGAATTTGHAGHRSRSRGVRASRTYLSATAPPYKPTSYGMTPAPAYQPPAMRAPSVNGHLRPRRPFGAPRRKPRQTKAVGEREPRNRDRDGDDDDGDRPSKNKKHRPREGDGSAGKDLGLMGNMAATMWSIIARYVAELIEQRFMSDVRTPAHLEFQRLIADPVRLEALFHKAEAAVNEANEPVPVTVAGMLAVACRRRAAAAEAEKEATRLVTPPYTPTEIPVVTATQPLQVVSPASSTGTCTSYVHVGA